ncbi:MAG: MFS transporter, partial [Chloroflexi bacterium]|nr:MFS transporter [Chloroflexota bacterium]
MRPDRWPFFYGWVIAGVAFVGSGLGSGVSIWGASVFVLPMTEELGWSRTEFFAAFAVRAVVVGVTAPVVGPWLDTRHGPRLMAIGGAFVLAGSMALLTYTEHLWQFMLLYGVLGGLAELGGGFVILITVLPKWFVAKRGRALGIASMGVGLGALLFPSSVSAVVDAEGWRAAWVWLGAATGTVWLLLALLVRTRPEDVGLWPDGAPQPPSEAPADGAGERSLTRGEAVRTPAFWLLLAASSLIALGIVGFQTNWLPFLLETGFSAAEASAGIAVYGLVSGLSRPVWGLLAERVPPRFLLAGSAAVTSVV